jgi:Ca2+/Na+ antiporter
MVPEVASVIAIVRSTEGWSASNVAGAVVLLFAVGAGLGAGVFRVVTRR